MYSTVPLRIGISWCVQYCVNKDRDLSVCLSVCLLFQKAEPSSRSCLCGAVPCAVLTINVHRLLRHVPHSHGTGHGKDSVKTVTCGYIMTLKA